MMINGNKIDTVRPCLGVDFCVCFFIVEGEFINQSAMNIGYAYTFLRAYIITMKRYLIVSWIWGKGKVRYVIVNFFNRANDVIFIIYMVENGVTCKD